VSAGFLRLFSRLLKSGGIIEFKTDNTGLFDYGLTQYEEAGFELLYRTYDLHADQEEMRENVMTEYEEKFSAKGNKICKFKIRVVQ
jgi:tRNA (guanine-N7-)-methyltransferase